MFILIMKIPYRSSRDIVENSYKYEGQWVALIKDSKTPVAYGERLSKVLEENL